MNFQRLLALSALIIALSFAYYFVIFLPSKEKAKQELKQFNYEKLINCLNSLPNVYSLKWKEACQNRQLDDNCRLPSTTADSISEFIENVKEDCYKLNPVD